MVYYDGGRFSSDVDSVNICHVFQLILATALENVATSAQKAICCQALLHDNNPHTPSHRRNV